MTRNVIPIIIILQLLVSTFSYAQMISDSTKENERQELVNTYLSFHQILWNYKITPDSTVSKFIKNVKNKILIQNKKEYLFFIEELGRICDGGVSEELDEAILDIYKNKTTILFDYIFITFPQNNIITDILLNSLYLNVEQSHNPKETVKDIKTFFNKAILPYKGYKYQMKRLITKFMLFEERANKFLNTSN